MLADREDSQTAFSFQQMFKSTLKYLSDYRAKVFLAVGAVIWSDEKKCDLWNFLNRLNAARVKDSGLLFQL